MFRIPTLYVAVGAIAVAGLALSGAYLKGRGDGRAALVAQLQADRIILMKDGRKIDDQVATADDPVLCALLGGCLPDGAEAE